MPFTDAQIDAVNLSGSEPQRPMPCAVCGQRTTRRAILGAGELVLPVCDEHATVGDVRAAVNSNTGTQ